MVEAVAAEASASGGVCELANDNGGHDNITAIIVCVLPATEYIRSLSDKKA